MPSVFQVVFSTISAGLGVIFNGYILFVLLWNRQIQTANRVLLFHLAFVDTIFCLVILLYNTTLGAIVTSSGTVPYDLGPALQNFSLSSASPTSGMCTVHGFVWTLLPVVVVWTICGLSCDRYAAISTPLHYSRLVNTRRAFIFVAVSWIGGVFLALPPILGVCPYTFWDSRWACAATCTSATTGDLWYAVAYVLLAVLVPVVIILVCNLHILMIARYHRHRIVSAIYEVTLRAQATVIHQRNPCYLSKFKGRSAFFTISQLVGSLVILTIPYYSVLIWEAANGKAGNAIFVSIATILLTCTPPVNAYVYGVKSRVLRHTLKRLLHRHLYEQGNGKVSRRLSEIFTDPSRRPPLLRRVSAPAGYGRKISQVSQFSCSSSNNHDSNVVAHSNKNLKHPFLRSSSLPANDACRFVSGDHNLINPILLQDVKSSKVVDSSHNFVSEQDLQGLPSEIPLALGKESEKPGILSTPPNKDNNERLKSFRKLTFTKSASFPVTSESHQQSETGSVILRNHGDISAFKGFVSIHSDSHRTMLTYSSDRIVPVTVSEL